MLGQGRTATGCEQQSQTLGPGSLHTGATTARVELRQWPCPSRPDLLASKMGIERRWSSGRQILEKFGRWGFVVGCEMSLLGDVARPGRLAGQGMAALGFVSFSGWDFSGGFPATSGFNGDRGEGYIYREKRHGSGSDGFISNT